MGRSIKLTQELQNLICDMLAAGNYIEAVCDYVGISGSTFYDWMRRGERGWKKDRDAGFSEFSQAVKKARAKAEVMSVAHIRKAGLDGQWQADAWFLERSFPERWGRRRMEVTGADGGDLVIRMTWGENADNDARST